MTDRDKTKAPAEIEDDALDAAQGGGTVAAHEIAHIDRRSGEPYIGETEKNVVSSPTGVTHDKSFEN